VICEARLIDGLSDDEVEAMFNAAREADYEALAQEVRAVTQSMEIQTAGAEIKGRALRLRANLSQIASIDFFGANRREIVDGMLAGLENALAEEGSMAGSPVNPRSVDERDSLKGRVWVTRRGVYIDRIASAWLIRRFIDPDAAFKFVAGKNYQPRPGEARFDMFEGEFTHEGDRCTFEVLLLKAGLNDPALTAIGEIVHDVDLKDAKFEREEANGIAHLMTGLCMASKDDMQRIERGTAVLNDLYEYFSKRRHESADGSIGRTHLS